VNFPPSGRANFSPSYYVKSKKILIWKGNFPPSGKVNFPFWKGESPLPPFVPTSRGKKFLCGIPSRRANFPRRFARFSLSKLSPFPELSPFSLSEKIVLRHFCNAVGGVNHNPVVKTAHFLVY